MTVSRELGSLSEREKLQDIGKRWRLLSPSDREKYSMRAQEQGGEEQVLGRI